MKVIVTEKGERYSYDENTGRMFRDGVLLSSVEVEPVFSENNKEGVVPKFSGILLKTKGVLLTLSGKEVQITDSNVI